MSTQYPLLPTNSELAGCVRAWRHRLPRSDPGVPGGPRRRRENITQEEIAEAVGVSVVWYSKLERGVRANYSAEFLDAVARELRLSADERVLLHLLAAGRRPPPSAADQVATVPDPSLRQVVNAQRWPTYILNRYARVVLHNESCESYYPWLRDDPSYPRWVLTTADARRRLLQWENDWVIPLLAQLRMTRAQHPGDDRIASLIDTCLRASPDVRRLWDAYGGHKQPAGSRRRIRLPGDHQVITVDVVTLTDLKPSELRVVMLIPAPDPVW
jgi:transcriptional regulator with XRE-family HTH domain